MANPTKSELSIPTAKDELQKLLERARNGDRSTVSILRRLVQDPQYVEQLGGNLARRAEESIIQSLMGKDLAAKEAIVRKLELLRTELAGPSPTPVERLLVDRVVVCWLHMQETEIRESVAKGMASTVMWAQCERWRESAHRSYLTALKTLAQVRKLAVPVLQLNIARTQVNLATSTEK